jgi:hypothetical protein
MIGAASAEATPRLPPLTNDRRFSRRQASAALRARSRSTNFWILPVAVVGRGPNTTDFGALKCAS